MNTTTNGARASSAVLLALVFFAACGPSDQSAVYLTVGILTAVGSGAS